ncbi:lathosterol oxidase [Metschnikowia aff. pulcherrima]|uniref:Lathosterol oxidase n=1 Tax=Metschnikowia aff. pulcherrima TaxID=2163413 RepID=A0A4P6XKK4_9ASCO|nr:lathosterol oxidase [Metschnikowia aff. pulcherrima]
MDLVLEAADTFLFDKAYAKLLPKDGAVARWVEEHFPTKLVANATMVSGSVNMPAPVTYLLNAVQSLQNKNDIYGKTPPNMFELSEYANQSFLSRGNLLREFITIEIITVIFGWILYFLVATLAYVFVFDKKIFNHPRYLKNQMSLEIWRAFTAIPIMVMLTAPFFLLELNGYSRLYLEVNETTGGWKAILLQLPAFILFTDCGIYFIHRILHWPTVYKNLHKPHHKWIVCTPFASHAFHPVDGWAQSLPYHLYPLIFPLNKVSYLFLFTFVNFWTVMIHDGSYWSNDPIVNGTACHTIHHLYFNYNYGQFTTLWDRLGNSYRRPDDSFFVKNEKTEEEKMWKDQTRKMEIIRGELEGKSDDRVYIEEK